MSLKDFLNGRFNPKGDPLAAAAEALLRLKTPFSQADGKLVIDGDLYLSGSGLTAFPDLTRVVVRGSVYAEGCGLTSLKGAPQVVGRNFFCDGNNLENLDGAPRLVGLVFDCQKNPRLTDASGAPVVFGSFVSDFASYASPAALAEAEVRKIREDSIVLKRAIGVKRITLKVKA